MDPHSRAPKKNTSHGNEVLPQNTTHLPQRPCYQRGSPCQDPAGNRTVFISDRTGIRQVPGGGGEQGKMEKTGCKIICGAPTTLVVKGSLMMIMMMNCKDTCLHALTCAHMYARTQYTQINRFITPTVKQIICNKVTEYFDERPKMGFVTWVFS